jgi:hypothetical protein
MQIVEVGVFLSSIPETHFPRQTHQETRLPSKHQASSSKQQNKLLYSPIHATNERLKSQPLLLLLHTHTFARMTPGKVLQAYLSRRFRFLFMYFVEKLLESILKGLVFGALVEFAHKVSAGAEGVVAKSQGSIAEILPGGKRKAIASASILLRRGGKEERERELRREEKEEK